MSQKRIGKYVVRMTEKRHGCWLTKTTWEVLVSSEDGLDRVATCIHRSHAVILAKALNKKVCEKKGICTKAF